jgi:hypothetical protein
MILARVVKAVVLCGYPLMSHFSSMAPSILPKFFVVTHITNNVTTPFLIQPARAATKVLLAVHVKKKV